MQLTAKVLLKGEAGCGAGKAQPFSISNRKTYGTSFRFFRQIYQKDGTDLCRLGGNEPEGISNQRGNVQKGREPVRPYSG